MAIQVSYLESKLAPDWGSFSRAFPHQPGPETVSSFMGDFDYPAIHRDPDGHWQREAKPVDMFKGNWQYPATITPEAVKSIGAGNLTLPASAGPPSSDGWAELSQIYFEISIDGKPLGRWSKLDGLSVKLEVAEHRTGDGDNYRWYEPSFSTFTNIKLTRASSVKGSGEILAWITHNQFAFKRGVTAKIDARPLWKNNSILWQLGLIDVMPVSWTGPQFASDGKLATETLEIAHSGFIDPHGSPSGTPPTGMPVEPPRAAFTAPPLPGPRTLKGIAEMSGTGAKGPYGLE
jgi:phage tail-like protein